MTDNLFDSLMACLNMIPSTDIPEEVSDFIQMISSAKYSTFLTAEKEAQYHALNIDAILQLLLILMLPAKPPSFLFLLCKNIFPLSSHSKLRIIFYNELRKFKRLYVFLFCC
jgi:hypothetical protein